MKLGVLCSGNGTNFDNIVRNPICNKHEVVIMIHNKKKCGAAKRAEKNKEDLPKYFAIVQGSNEEPVTLLDDTNVAQPKKSGGFFSWLMGDA